MEKFNLTNFASRISQLKFIFFLGIYIKIEKKTSQFSRFYTILSICSPIASRIRYEITSGNIGGAFAVKNMTGAIYVAGALDYETRKRVSKHTHTHIPGENP